MHCLDLNEVIAQNLPISHQFHESHGTDISFFIMPMSDADHGNTLLCDREQLNAPVVTSRRPLPIRQVRLAMSSSTNSLEDRNASSILGASIWNHEKAIRHVEGVPKWGIGGDLGEASDSNTRRHSTDRQEISNQFKDANNDYRALLNRRAYPTLSYPARSSSENTSGRLQPPTLDKKSELESAVLFDCLANNVLFAHLQTEEVEALISHFEKVQARKNELIIHMVTRPTISTWYTKVMCK